MKTIVMTTESVTPVNMQGAGRFETGKPQTVENAVAESLLKRNFPKFQEVSAKGNRQTPQEVNEHA